MAVLGREEGRDGAHQNGYSACDGVFFFERANRTGKRCVVWVPSASPRAPSRPNPYWAPPPSDSSAAAAAGAASG